MAKEMAMHFTYNIDALGVDYGLDAYLDVAKRVGRALLREVTFYSGDSAATLRGEDNAYIVAVVGSERRLDEIRTRVFEDIFRRHLAEQVEEPRRLRSFEKAPLNLSWPIGRVAGEPLVFNGAIDAEGIVRADDDGSMLHCLKSADEHGRGEG